MTKRVLSLLVSGILCSSMLFAQKVDDAKKFIYYERYKSAKDILDKKVAEDPNDAEATYWLGQVLLKTKDSAGAKALYQKALTANGNAPLILVGMGQTELMEGKTNEARQHFETAINLSKGKDVDVLNAIGTANVDARNGDATYAVQKLTQATTTKKFKNAYTYLIMGDAYRKLIDGGNEVTSYTKALELDPTLAAAKVRIGRIYLTQNNPDYFLPAWDEAAKIDSTYAPTYFEQYYYWYFRDVNKAGAYLDKYIAHTDPGPEMEYAKTDYTYAKGDFAGAQKRARELIAQNKEKVSPRMYRMIAYTADTLGDIQTAKGAMDTFLLKADTSIVLATDYEEMAKIYSKMGAPDSTSMAASDSTGSDSTGATVAGNSGKGMYDSLIAKYYNMAIDKDTVAANKAKFIANAAAMAKRSGNRNLEAEWLGRAYAMEKEPSQNDLYNWAHAHYAAGNYVKADSLFCNTYKTKFPDAIYGYLWCARARTAQDTTMEKGLAVDAYKELATKALALDSGTGKFKTQAIVANFYLVSYYNDIAKSKDTALAYLDKVLEIDSTNEDAVRIKKILTAPPPKKASSSTTNSSSKAKAKTKSKSGTKPKSSAKKSSD